MSLFQVPPETPYDLRFTLFGIPVRVHPLFWLLAILFGASLGNFIFILIWVVIVFVSILVHELGHSIAMRRYGQDSFIVLHLMGGLAVPIGGRWGSSRTSDQQIVISLAGPIAGFLLAAIVLAIVSALGGTISVSWLFGFLPIPSAFLPSMGSTINFIIRTLLWVNVFWGLINLAPIYPLDGGQVARQLFIKADPYDGVRKSLWLSVISGAILAIVGIAYLGSGYMAFLFGILAFQSYQAVQGRF